MVIFCVSDLHLHDDHQPYLFTNEKEKTLALVAGEVLREPEAVLILAGDFLDLTGMNPPLRGLREFFERVLPANRVGDALQLAGQPLDAATRIRSIAARFPHAFDALAELARAGRLQFIPGNHDWEAHSTPGGRAALASVVGVEPSALPVHEEYFFAGVWVGAHGHHYDPSNLTTRGFANPGQAITAALYRALIPALRVLGVAGKEADAIPAVRPEENIVVGLQEALPAETAAALLRALVRLLYDNGYFAGLGRLAVWLAMHLLPFTLTPKRVRARLADDTDLKAQFRRIADNIVQGREAGFPHPNTRMVVFGHTHEFDFTRGRYVNSGTWIDHVSGLTHAELANPDRTLPVVRVAGDHVEVRDARGLGSKFPDLSGAPIMTAFDIE